MVAGGAGVQPARTRDEGPCGRPVRVQVSLDLSPQRVPMARPPAAVPASGSACVLRTTMGVRDR